MLLVYEGFLPPILSVLPPGQNRILPGGQKQKQWGQKIFSRPSGAILPPLIFFLPPLNFFSAPAKINPAHATVYSTNKLIVELAFLTRVGMIIFCIDSIFKFVLLSPFSVFRPFSREGIDGIRVEERGNCNF